MTLVRTGGGWIFLVSFVYFLAGMFCFFQGIDSIILGPLYVFFLALPFLVPPLGRLFNLDINWDIKMFDWLKNKGKLPENVVPFPAKGPQGPQGYLEPPKEEKEKPAHTFYRLGITDNNRVSLSMGYSEITMNAAGIDNMIKQLECFRDQLHVEEEEGEQ